MKRIFLFSVFLVVFTLFGYWVGHQDGQREMKTLMKAYEASRLSDELYDWVGPKRDPEYEQQLTSELDKTFIYYGAYISNELPFYQGGINRGKETEILFNSAVKRHRHKVDLEKRLSELNSTEDRIKHEHPEIADDLIKQNRNYLKVFSRNEG